MPVTSNADPSSTRRRGDTLEQAIFSATIDIAKAQGYAAVTFANVAEAAHTSRSVIYRRWHTPFELLNAAVASELTRSGEAERLLTKTYSNGSLRADLVQMLGDFARRADFAATTILVQALHAELSQDSREITPFLKNNEDNDLQIIDKLLQAAYDAGELKRTPQQIPRTVRLLPFELIRYHAAFLRETMSKRQIEELADDAIMPLLVG
jgi:AcrR family transcriptional regulator